MFKWLKNFIFPCKHTWEVTNQVDAPSNHIDVFSVHCQYAGAYEEKCTKCGHTHVFIVHRSPFRGHIRFVNEWPEIHSRWSRRGLSCEMIDIIKEFKS
jgi:hypothetical protein